MCPHIAASLYSTQFAGKYCFNTIQNYTIPINHYFITIKNK